jgi:hypothetical protein
VHLLRLGLRREALALAAEHLALEPLDLTLQRLDLVGLRAQHRCDLMRIERGHFSGP